MILLVYTQGEENNQIQVCELKTFAYYLLPNTICFCFSITHVFLQILLYNPAMKKKLKEKQTFFIFS